MQGFLGLLLILGTLVAVAATVALWLWELLCDE